MERDRDGGSPLQTVEKVNGLDAADIDDPYVRMELGIGTPISLAPPSGNVSGLALIDPSEKRAEKVAPISQPEVVAKSIEDSIQKAMRDEEQPDDSARSRLQRQLDRADSLAGQGLKRHKDEEDRKGLERLKDEIRAADAAHRWVEQKVLNEIRKRSKKLAVLLALARRPLGIDSSAPASDGDSSLSLEVRCMAAETALGLATPGYDIANLVVAMATGETIVGEKIEGSLAWGLLGAAAVLSVVEPFGSKTPALKAVEKSLRKSALSDEAARGLLKLAEAGHESVIEPLLKHSEEAAEQIGRILSRAEKFEVKSAAEANETFVQNALKNGFEGFPPHHPEFPLIEVTRASDGTKAFVAHSAGKDVSKSEWISLTDPRSGTKAAYRDEMAVMDRFQNKLEQVSTADVGGENFTLSIANPLKDPLTGEFRKGGGLQGMFKKHELPSPTKWSDPVDWIE